MKKLIQQIDRLLMEISVKGESVILLADARTALGKLYRMATEADTTETEATDDG